MLLYKQQTRGCTTNIPTLPGVGSSKTAMFVVGRWKPRGTPMQVAARNL
jgi:hypothetical protein